MVSNKKNQDIINPIIYAYNNNIMTTKALAYIGCFYFEEKNNACILNYTTDSKSKVFINFPPIGPLHGVKVTLSYIEKFLKNKSNVCNNKNGYSAFSTFMDVEIGNKPTTIYFILVKDEKTLLSIENTNIVTTYYPIFVKNEKNYSRFWIQPLFIIPQSIFTKINKCIKKTGKVVFNYNVSSTS